jgi:hypothetical protein
VKAIVPRQPLTEHDWNFSRVPDSELIPCLLWEILRESPTARQLGQAWAEFNARAKEAQTRGETL